MTMPAARRGAIPVIEASAADIVELTNKVHKVSKFKHLKVYVPFVVWILWLFVGAVWYAVHDGFSWTLAYYTSVDIGLSITWNAPKHTPHKFYSSSSKIFSMLHLTVGAIFEGAIVFFIAQEMIKKKGDWMIQAMHRNNLQEVESSTFREKVHSFFVLYFTKFKVVVWTCVIIFVGVVWFANTIPTMSLRTALDYVISALTGAGYSSLPDDTVWWQYIIAATMTGGGAPVLSIAIGLAISGIVHKTNDNDTYAKIVEDITPQEIEFMKMFEIDDGDGAIDQNEFIILTVVRIGATPPDLIHQINIRFKELDRHHTGVLKYDDIVFGRAKRRRSFVREASAALVGRMNSWRGSDGTSSVSPIPALNDSTDREVVSSESQRSKVVSATNNQSSNLDIAVTKRSVEKSLNRFLSRLSSRHDVAPLPVAGSEDRVSPSQKPAQLSWAPSVSISEATALHVMDALEPKTGGRVRPSPVDASVELAATQQSGNKDAVVPGKSLPRHAESPMELEDVEDLEDDDANETPVRSSGRQLMTPLSLTDERTDSDKKESHDDVRPPVTALRIDTFQSGSDVSSFKSNRDGHMTRPVPEVETPGHAIARRITQSFQRGLKTNVLLSAKHKKKKLNDVLKHRRDAIFALLRIYIINPYFQAVLAWSLWLLVGTIFYFLYMGNMNWARAFHLSASIGYSMFWNAQTEFDATSKIFSIVYLLIGRVIIGGLLAVFAKYLTDSKNWYVEALRRKALEEAAATDGWLDDVLPLVIYYNETIKLMSAFFVWFAFGAVYVAVNFNFTAIDSIFFAISSLSSGGRIAIPEGAADVHYIVVGLYVMTGIPVMAIAMGVIAHAIVFTNESAEALQDKMMARITETELELMKAFGIEDGSGDIDAQEFVILTLVRIGALEPELIKMITELYSSLAEDSNGALTYEALQNLNSTGKEGSPIGTAEKRKSLINKNLSPNRRSKCDRGRTQSEDIV